MFATRSRLLSARRRHGMRPVNWPPTSYSAEAPACAASYLVPEASWSLNDVLLESSSSAEEHGVKGLDIGTMAQIKKSYLR